MFYENVNAVLKPFIENIRIYTLFTILINKDILTRALHGRYATDNYNLQVSNYP